MNIKLEYLKLADRYGILLELLDDKGNIKQINYGKDKRPARFVKYFFIKSDWQSYNLEEFSSKLHQLQMDFQYVLDNYKIE